MAHLPLALAIVVLSSTASASEATGRASVIDGDTIEIHGERIRLHGIDAPESAQLCRRDGEKYRCGQRAAFVLADKIGQATVACERRERDRYGRTVGLCRLGTEDLGAFMVVNGWALAYRKYGGDRYDAEEAEAKRERRGVWAGDFDPPWEWRKGNRTIEKDKPAPGTMTIEPASSPKSRKPKCRKGCPCGNSCISCDKTCRK